MKRIILNYTVTNRGQLFGYPSKWSVLSSRQQRRLSWEPGQCMATAKLDDEAEHMKWFCWIMRWATHPTFRGQSHLLPKNICQEACCQIASKLFGDEGDSSTFHHLSGNLLGRKALPPVIYLTSLLQHASFSQPLAWEWNYCVLHTQLVTDHMVFSLRCK